MDTSSKFWCRCSRLGLNQLSVFNDELELVYFLLNRHAFARSIDLWARIIAVYVVQ